MYGVRQGSHFNLFPCRYPFSSSNLTCHPYIKIPHFPCSSLSPQYNSYITVPVILANHNNLFSEMSLPFLLLCSLFLLLLLLKYNIPTEKYTNHTKCTSEQNPDFPTASPSHQEAFTGLLFLPIRGQTVKATVISRLPLPHPQICCLPAGLLASTMYPVAPVNSLGPIPDSFFSHMTYPVFSKPFWFNPRNRSRLWYLLSPPITSLVQVISVSQRP